MKNSLGIVNPKELKLSTDTFIPSKTVNWGDGTPEQPDDSKWNDTFGIGSMGIAADNLKCDQSIKVERLNVDGTSWNDCSAKFNYHVRTKKAPTALWGTKLKPGVNDRQFIDNTLAGLEIEPGEPPTAGRIKEIDRSFIRYETTPIDNAIQWFDGTAFNAAELDEAGARNEINTSIKTNTGRDALLESLGITAPIDLTDSIANAYVLPPQIAN